MKKGERLFQQKWLKKVYSFLYSLKHYLFECYFQIFEGPYAGISNN